jgi:malonyl-CoA O-methyltransferase
MLKRNFNKAAESYDKYAQLQQLTGNKLLDLIRSKNLFFKNIIDLGCGTGLITKNFAKTFTYENFYAIDIAEQLLLQANKNLHKHAIQIKEANFENFTPDIAFNLIYANMALHWGNDFINTIKHWLGYRAHNGIFAFTIPLHGTFAELANYVNIRSFAKKEDVLQNFNVTQYTCESITFEFASLLHALRSIKRTGANFVKRNTNGLTINSHLQQLLLNNPLDSTTLTYHIGYFILE